jgi:hypothetical protein
MNSARNPFGFRGKEFGTEEDVGKSPNRSAQRIELNGEFFIDLGCATWKLHQKMFDAQTGEAQAEFRQLARHVETIRDRLSELGLQIQDHTGQPYDSGQSLEVLAFQPTHGILSETVVETVRPTLYLREQRILRGQVIVGIPMGSEGSQK